MLKWCGQKLFFVRIILFVLFDGSDVKRNDSAVGAIVENKYYGSKHMRMVTATRDLSGCIVEL